MGFQDEEERYISQRAEFICPKIKEEEVTMNPGLLQTGNM